MPPAGLRTPYAPPSDRRAGDDGPTTPSRTLAVALHGVEPATFERSVEARTWLAERGVERVTLLVIPARDLHPLGERSPELIAWLAERRRAGDAIAQHGFRHVRLGRGRRRGRLAAPGHRRRAAEFAGLDAGETRNAVAAGWRVLKLAGVEPDGFVAPAYAYTPVLRQVVAARFRWWADGWWLHGGADRPWRCLAPAWGPAAVGVGAMAETGMRAVGACLPASVAGATLRIDLSPGALLRGGRNARALERTLASATAQRRVVTFDELAQSLAPAPGDGRLPGEDHGDERAPVLRNPLLRPAARGGADLLPPARRGGGRPGGVRAA